MYSKIAREKHVITCIHTYKNFCHAAVVFVAKIHFPTLQQLHLRLVEILTGEFMRQYSCALYKNCICSRVFRM